MTEPPARPEAPPAGGAAQLRPPAEVVLTTEVVRELLSAQHPDLARLALTPAGGGWDNEMWRLGPDLAVRLPRRSVAAQLVRNEQRWLPVLAPRLPVAVPVPVRTGVPQGEFPWHWSVVPWLAGRPAWSSPVPARRAWAARLAEALTCLHVPAPDDAPPNPYRGTPLAARDAAVRDRLGALGPPHADGLLRRWEDALAAPPWDGPPTWVHGDPHPANLLVHGAGLSALLDFGDVTAGDPATDLSTAWLTFDADGRTTFRRSVRPHDRTGADEGLWRRARGWAVAMVSAMLVHAPQDPVIGGIGRHGCRQLLQDRLRA